MACVLSDGVFTLLTRSPQSRVDQLFAAAVFMDVDCFYPFYCFEVVLCVFESVVASAVIKVVCIFDTDRVIMVESSHFVMRQ